MLLQPCLRLRPAAAPGSRPRCGRLDKEVVRVRDPAGWGPRAAPGSSGSGTSRTPGLGIGSHQEGSGTLEDGSCAGVLQVGSPM